MVFEDMIFKPGEELPEEIYTLSGLSAEYKNTNNLLSSVNQNGDVYIAVKSQIGKEPHPMIRIAGCTYWHTEDNNGYYITGFDLKKRDFFQIIT